MANKTGHRRFGSVRKRASGRYQVRYPGPDSQTRTAPQTFERKTDADRYLSLMEAQILRGEWRDPARATVKLGEYAGRWISQRPALRPRTVQLYQWLFGKHIAPHIGGVPLSKLDTAMVREWRAALLESGVSESVTAKAYRLLRAILMTAVKVDEIIAKNPCRIPGADQEKPPERSVLTVAQVFALTDRIPDRYRALVLLSTFACLRWGEVTPLQRRDLEIVTRSRSSDREEVEAGDGHRAQGVRGGARPGPCARPPKSRAGRRTVSIPHAVVPVLVDHLARYVAEGPDALVFTGPTGAPIWRGNFNKLARWPATVAELGVPGLHFHDLRHTGNTLAARTGASLRDLMARMGHDSPDAAMIYQHATREADRAIA